MATALLGSKASRALVTKTNESAAAAPSEWARKLLEKQGWKSGSGLGKHEQGMTSHIRVTRKAETEGIGFVEKNAAVWNEQWWSAAYASASSSPIGGTAAVTNHSSSSDEDTSSESGSESERETRRTDGVAKQRENASPSHHTPSFDELFRATGGARLGMHARRPQEGKWKRAEEDVEMASAAARSKATTTAITSTTATRNTNSSHTDEHSHSTKQSNGKHIAGDATTTAITSKRKRLRTDNVPEKAQLPSYDGRENDTAVLEDAHTSSPRELDVFPSSISEQRKKQRNQRN